VAIAAGILLGHFWPDQGTAMKPLGDAFIKLVKMIIAPVIFLTVATGIAGMSDLQKVGRVAGKAMIYFLTFSTLALIIGLVVGNVVQPGAGLHINPASSMPRPWRAMPPRRMTRPSPASCRTSSRHDRRRLRLATSCRCCSSRCCSVSLRWSASAASRSGLPAGADGADLQAGRILMKAAPIGAFGAMAFTIGRYGIGSVANLAMLIGTFYLTSLIFILVVLGAVARYNGFSILR
jgi:aerobic C4-dicarboxylate transport protein